MKRIVAATAASLIAVSVVGCASDADVVSANISKAADQFQIDRRIVFLNVRHSKYELVIEGKCNINDDGKQLEVTCKTGPNDYQKHFLGKAGDMTYFVFQMKSANVSKDQYKVIFKPESIVPDVDRG
ncbi:beta-sandwich lipoprotein [Nocardia goodfellowii]